MQLYLTALGMILSLTAGGIYIVDIVRGKTKPHLYTYLTWSIVATIAFLGSLASGGGYAAWIVGSGAMLSTAIFLLSFKYGTADIHWFDTVFLVGALVAIVPWILLKDPLWSVVLAVFISVCGYCPTIRKTWRAPETEHLSAWVIGCATAAMAIAALETFNITTILYPAQILVMDIFLVYIIISRRKKSEN
jgi:hypothetical protein